MKTKLMCKTVNQLAPQRLCNVFQVSTVNIYNERGSSTELFIHSRPKSAFFKDVLVIVGLNNGIEYQKILENRHLTIRSAKTFSPWPK